MLDKKLLEQFSTFLAKNIGSYYPKERWHDLEKKLVLIKNSLGFDDIAVCLDWLMNNPIDKEKLDLLIDHFTIGETYFFRDKQLFTALKQHIIPDIVQHRLKERTIRIWSAGCSTGEEPYSIAILLHRLIPNIKDWKISICGSDINQKFLLKAEKAQYKKWSFRSMPPDILEYYFKKNEDETFTLIPEIKSMVNFKQLNLVDDTYPDITKGMHELDLIFCQHVLIYFSKSQIKKTVHKLTKALCNKGWLSVAAIEVPYIAEAGLQTHRFPGSVFFKKELLSEKDYQEFHSNNIPAISHLTKKDILALPVPIKSWTSSPVVKEQEKSNDDLLDECLHLHQQKAYQELIDLLKPRLTLLKNDSMAIKEHLKEVVLLIHTYANQGDLLSALEWSERAIEADHLDPNLHYLHATLLLDQDNILEAIKSVKNALFIDPNFMMAYLLMGIIEKQRGKKKAALRCFKTALDLIDKHHPDNTLLNAEEFTPEYLKDLILNNLKNLQETDR